jgi:hypothetical protein
LDTYAIPTLQTLNEALTMKKPKKPEPTAREVAVTARQERALDEEIAEEEGRLRS